MGMTITDEQIEASRAAFDANPANIVAQNAVTSVQLPSLALNRSDSRHGQHLQHQIG